jgi:predicted kinase
MKISPNTIVVMVGPSNCGKSFFSKKILIPALEGAGKSFHYLSSDDIRADLCGKRGDYDKYSSELYTVSKQAFSILENKLECLVTYPVNTEVVIVDSTALREDFRNKIVELAKKNFYKVQFVVFDYKGEDYYNADGDKSVIKKHVDQFKKDVLPNLSKLKTTNSSVYKIASKEKASATVIEFEQYAGKYLTLDTENYAVIGDIHGNLAALESGIKATQKFEKVVFVGDIIDKNKNICDINRCLEILLADDRFILIRGNHEHFFVSDRQNGHNIGHDVRQNYFNTTISPSKETIDLVTRYYERAYDGVITKNAVITHSPCPVANILKHDKTSIKLQRGFRYDSENILESLGFINTEQSPFTKYHVWGHVPLERYFINKGNIGIDTGACYGNYLTILSFKFNRPEFIKIKTEKVVDDDKALIDLNFKKDQAPKVTTDPRLLDKSQVLISKGVRYLSPTMSPTDKLDGKLESIEAAAAYYKSVGVTEICIQPKFMGSRAQVYLKTKLEDCYAVSKNGFVIREELNQKLMPSYQKLKENEHLRKWFKNHESLVILDCELLPWSAMAEELIDKTFSGYSWLYRQQIESRNNLGFFNLIHRMKETLPLEDYKTLSKKEFIEKYGHHNYENCKGFLYISQNVVDNRDVELENLNKFDEQVKNYSIKEEPYLEPFDILKATKCEDDLFYDYTSTSPLSSVEWFGKLNTNPYYVGPIDGDYQLDSLKNHYGRPLEGFVVKPANNWNKSIAPYLKVRNPEYLRMVYGPDYLNEEKYSKLLAKKNVKFKMQDSISAYNSNIELLLEFYGNPVQAMANCLVVKNGEKNADPRF